jgi:antitoxin component YwqK of YwqJK toxin-antitoxin module
VVENYKNQPNLFLFTEYYRSGTVSMKAISINKDAPRFEGPRIDYYENGNKKQESNYVGNKLSGKQIDWYENKVKKSEKEIVWHTKTRLYFAKTLQSWDKEGQLIITNNNNQYEYSDDQVIAKGELKNGEKQGIWEGKALKEKFSFTEIYNDGVFISGISTDENNNKHPYKELMEKATPAKGMDDFFRHIGRNYKTPSVQGLKGKVYLTFIIDKEGSLTNFKILRDIGYGTGQEGIKAIASYGKWIPGKMRGIPSKTSFSLPISIVTSGIESYQGLEPTFNSEMNRNTNSRW